jgi:uncharacterized protein YhaN
MKITDLHVDGFGVWTDLKVKQFADGLNVLFGPNEAGKSTLLQFVRSMLYGFSPARMRYIPPLHGGESGGEIDFLATDGAFQIARHYAADDESGNPERLALTAADGTRFGEHALKSLLYNVDETLFNNVFAVGLREMQELGTLGDTEAASLLYNLTAGLDRVSLVEVVNELGASCNNILDGDGKPSQAGQLLAQRDKLREEIEEIAAAGRRHGRLAAEHSQVEQEAALLQQQQDAVEREHRVLELAAGLRERWRQRAMLDEQLKTLGPVPAIPPGTIKRLNALNDRIKKHRGEDEELQLQMMQLREDETALSINESLSRNAARVEAIAEQEPWLLTLQNQIGQLDAEIAEIQSNLAEERRRLGLGSADARDELPMLSPRQLASLRAPAKFLASCRGRVEEAAQELAEAEKTAESLGEQIQSALSAIGRKNLASDLESASGLVSQLRRRVQLDQRIEQMSRSKADLEERSDQLPDKQALSPRILTGLGAVFILGVVLLLAGLVLPGAVIGPLGWALAMLGLVGSAAAAGLKVTLERFKVQKMDNCQKQLQQLKTQLEQANQERDALNKQLPRGNGSIAERLEAAEKDLAALEELVPLDTRRGSGQSDVEDRNRRLNEAKKQVASARRAWREALGGIGLPETLAPKQARQLAQRYDQIGQLQRRMSHRREELKQRKRELDALAARIAQLASDCGLSLENVPPLERMHKLSKALLAQEAATSRRVEIRKQIRRIRRRQAKHHQAVGRLRHIRRVLLLEAGAKDEQAFRQRALEVERAEKLKADRDSLDREITAVIGGYCPAETIAEQIESPNAENIDSRRALLLERLTALKAEVRQCHQRLGQLGEQLRMLADDRRLGLKQLELGTVEKRLEDAMRRWQVLAVTRRALDSVRIMYERDRQPETLQAASGYLDRMTGGRYRRVWTPLSEQTLLVEDAEGRSLPVETLSRGTREQLFLGLRLALAVSYSRRGAPMPLVLDDVLVNFDAERAHAAAALLRDFAAEGHQVLVFTCHEHILRLFKSLHAPVGSLPDNGRLPLDEVVFEQTKPPRQARVADPSPRKTAAKAKPADPVEEEVALPMNEPENEPKNEPENKPLEDSDAAVDAPAEQWDEASDDSANTIKMFDVDSMTKLPKAFSVRDDHEFLPMRHLLERMNPKIVLKQVAYGVHVNGREAVYWGIAHLRGKPPTKKEIDGALSEAGFDFARNAFSQAATG